MPGSSVGSASSLGSAGSRRAASRRYRTVNPGGSTVDETLFGSTKKTQQTNGRGGGSPFEEELQTDRRLSSGNNKSKKAGRETIQVITKDLIRNLIVPMEDPSGQSIILHQGEFARIKSAARVLTKEERERLEEMRKREKEEAIDACAQRKTFMKVKDLDRKQNEKLNDLEEEAQEQAQYLLEKAKKQQEEQEDEIKALNELILNAKCHAIRDAQILEKGVIQKELTEEEKRLDLMMEVDRVNDLKLQEEITLRRKQERLIGKQQIIDQIQQNEEDRLLDQEKKDQEARQMLQYLEKLQMEDLKELERKRLQQLDIQVEIQRANQEADDMRAKKAEQERLADQKVIEYQKQRAQREAEYEAEQERIKKEKEKEVARLRALQERAKDLQAEKDALRAKRNQEQAEREWRKKEREEARLKAEMEELLKRAREDQVMSKEHFLAVQAQRERSEFERVLREQKRLIEKEKEDELRQHDMRLNHADAVRKQIREKEQVRINDRNAFFEEGVKLDEEARQRRAKLDDIKKKKLNELKNAGVPEKYCAEVERKINQPAGLEKFIL
ncbi:cilia- and flagella-associated protein 45-like [Branchiostoma floridae]|uniref:Cilia- and flagella-associated protein 45 n=1 Tax=Branchiostoma floridae TaxID=7739 RepID=A0A9J7L2L1_BRAFL|nr:cilia- and flagella-associated protein 45-like [Branchiostoma floridae]